MMYIKLKRVMELAINMEVVQNSIDHMTTITNREDLKDYIHGIHNFLRNSGIGYGMNALKTFNVFYGLYMVSKNDEIYSKTNLSEEYRFQNIYAEKDVELRFEKIRQFLVDLYRKSTIKKFLSLM